MWSSLKITNNQDARYNNQIITNQQIPITNFLFDDWLLNIGIYLRFGNWLLII
jgi:hypothetical protein